MTTELPDIPIQEDNQNIDFQVEQKESIKLTKNSKGYNWEVKLLEINLERLDEINKQLIERYGK